MNPAHYEETAPDLLELASEQRMNILFSLLEKKAKISKMAKEMDVTVQEVFRNFDRMAKNGLIEKDTDGYYNITTFGKAICRQIPSLAFLSKNRGYFDQHNFGDMPIKFIQRIGALEKTELIDGVVRILEKWKSIYKNSEEYVFEVLYELPPDLTQPLIKRVKQGVKLHHVISENAIVPKGRKKILQEEGFRGLIESGRINRRMKKYVRVALIMNEKEGCVAFTDNNDNPDITQMFYGTDETFLEWCKDYFRYCWDISDSFREYKLD